MKYLIFLFCFLSCCAMAIPIKRKLFVAQKKTVYDKKTYRLDMNNNNKNKNDFFNPSSKKNVLLYDTTENLLYLKKQNSIIIGD